MARHCKKHKRADGTQVLLCSAYCQLHVAGSPAACLRCIETLRQRGGETGGGVAAALLAFQALLSSGQLKEAEAEATGAVRVRCIELLFRRQCRRQGIKS